MKFGFFMMPAHAPTENPTLAFQRDLQMVQLAESMGFDEVWVGEHHTGGWETVPAPDLFLATAAERTKRIRLGTAVVNLPYHHPFHVAERMAFLDHLTFGRVSLGVGPGLLPSDIKMFGIEPEDLRPMANEALEIILKLYRESGAVTYEGRYWTLREMELQIKPYQRPHLPVAVASGGGGSGPALAGKNGLQLLSANFGNFASGEALAGQWDSYEAAAAEAGHRADRSEWRIALYVYLADSTEQALADVKDGAERQAYEYFANVGIGSVPEANGQASRPPFSQLLDERGWIVCDPGEGIRRLKEVEKAAGGFGGILLVPPEWTSREKWDHCLELFARYVMPQFQDSLTGVQSSFERMARQAAEGTLPNPYAAAQPPPEG